MKAISFPLHVVPENMPSSESYSDDLPLNIEQFDTDAEWLCQQRSRKPITIVFFPSLSFMNLESFIAAKFQGSCSVSSCECHRVSPQAFKHVDLYIAVF